MTNHNTEVSGSKVDSLAAVTDLYDLYREARMNVKYYGEKIASYQRWILTIEVAVALGTSGTVVSLPIFSTTAGKIIVIGAGTIAAILGVLKPILNLSKKIERSSKLWSGYLAIFNGAGRIVRAVQIHQEIDDRLAVRIEELHDRMDVLSTDDDPSAEGKTLERLQNEVND
ncbi:MAG: hypothetical protein ACHRHE_12430, partial [Tepidisphaerales bacterium]